MELCRLAVQEQPLCSVSDVELRRGGKSYTADTLHILSEERPKDHLYLLMGEDMFSYSTGVAQTGRNLEHGRHLCRSAQPGRF